MVDKNDGSEGLKFNTSHLIQTTKEVTRAFIAVASAATAQSAGPSVVHYSKDESGSPMQKVVVHVRSTGDAPILKQSKFKISGRDKFLKVIEFLRRQLHQDTLFVYINRAFSPNPDELVIDLCNNFGIDGKLVVNYALSAAWG